MRSVHGQIPRRIVPHNNSGSTRVMLRTVPSSSKTTTTAAVPSCSTFSTSRLVRQPASASDSQKQQQQQVLSKYPGAPNVPFTSELLIKGSFDKFPIYRVMDPEGRVENKDHIPKELTNEKLVDIYKTALKLNNLDTILYEAQRQGRISFYMTNYGEEAAQIGSAAALIPEDTVYSQYREAGVLMYRGFTLDEFMAQCFSTKDDYGKGRQMPVHYGKAALNFQTVSSPLATQIPQAAGYGYALKLSGQKLVCMCYFGEGAASEGDFHAALNFASTLGGPTLFFCRNNGYAISTPVQNQYHGDGIAGRGVGYGMHTIRVDGNDLFAVYNATKKARELAVENQVPVLIEAMTYRGGHHSTSDDASRYRSNEELQYWRTQQNPITRIRKYLESKSLWNDTKESEWNDKCRNDVLEAMDRAEHSEKPHVEELFQDVFDVPPSILKEQKKALEAQMRLYPEYYQQGSH